MKETFASVCLLKDIRPPVFSALLTYVYTDTLQLQRPEDITELLVVSNQVKQRVHPTGTQPLPKRYRVGCAILFVQAPQQRARISSRQLEKT